MKKSFLILSFLLLTAIAAQAQDPHFWIVLCFGQSNMAGSTAAEAQDSIVPDGFLSLSAVNGTDGRRIGEWRKAVPPICRQNTKLSPIDQFGKEVLAHAPEGTRLGVVSVAVEGCPITFFDKDRCGEVIAQEKRDWMNNILNEYGRNPYQRLVDMARKAQKEGVIKAILLHQGETDAYDRDWQKSVYKIYKDLQQDLKLDSFSVPLFVGEVARKEYNGTCAHANPTINDIVNHYHNVYVVSAEGCPPSADGTHFSAEGYRELGRHYAEAFLHRTMREATKGRRESSHTETVVSAPSIEIEATLDDQGRLVAQASEPLQQVDVVSFSGETVATIACDGQPQAVIDLNALPQETLVFVFKAVSGATNTLKLEQ